MSGDAAAVSPHSPYLSSVFRMEGGPGDSARGFDTLNLAADRSH